MSIIVTLYFKLMTFNWIKMTKKVMAVTFLIFHTPVLFSGCLEIYLVITAALPKDVQDYYSKLNIDVSEYAVIGTLKLQTVSLINFLIMVGAVFVYPVVSLYLRRRILTHLGHHVNNFSKHNKSQHRSFVTGLTIQSILPFLIYFPTFALYVFCIFTKTEIIAQQYFIYLMPAFTAFLDPFVTLYFVVPYRKRLMRLLGINRNTLVSAASVSTVTGAWN
uniref:Serpentine Receptor, class D (Delta) n=2 Tax=Caenorhabditis tropicalis TaxID=1561998 RepID=A0A1I7TN83_9PELO